MKFVYNEKMTIINQSLFFRRMHLNILFKDLTFVDGLKQKR